MTVVTDTSVVLNLCFLRHDHLLAELFGRIQAPHLIAEEFNRLSEADPRFRHLIFPSYIECVDPSAIDFDSNAISRLHPGEIAALALAREINADLILMDERAGRNFAASIGLRTMGLLGILVASRQRNLIPRVAPLLDRLSHEARFWISQNVRTAVLRSVGEVD